MVDRLKFLIAIVFSLPVLAYTVSQKSDPKTCKPQSPVRSSVEAKAGYFFFSSSKMRKVYDSGGLDVQLSGSANVWKWLQVYGCVEYLQRDGHSLGAHEKTNIWIVPLSLGLKPVITICPQIGYYLTIGPRYFFVHTHADSSFVQKDLNEHGIGGFANMGFNFFPMDHFLIDIFGEYSYKRMSFHPSKPNTYGRTIQIGGFTFGAGLGYAF